MFGILAILVGVAAVLFGLLTVVLARIGAPGGVQVDERSAWVSLILYAAIGAVLIWAGVGSLRRRRWVRSVMLTLGWSWLLGGLMLWLLVLSIVDEVLVAGPVAKAVLLGVFAVAGVILPGSFIWVYRDRDLLHTCQLHDTVPNWSDRCPTTVLGLSLALWASAVLILSVAVYAVVPVFGYLVTGGAAVLLSVLGGAVCAWLAYSTYKLQPVGWWATTLAMLLLGASTAAPFLFVEPATFLREMGYPEELAAMYRTLSGPAVVWGTAVSTLLSVAYMVAIRKHFDPAASRP